MFKWPSGICIYSFSIYPCLSDVFWNIKICFNKLNCLLIKPTDDYQFNSMQARSFAFHYCDLLYPLVASLKNIFVGCYHQTYCALSPKHIRMGRKLMCSHFKSNFSCLIDFCVQFSASLLKDFIRFWSEQTICETLYSLKVKFCMIHYRITSHVLILHK